MVQSLTANLAIALPEVIYTQSKSNSEANTLQSIIVITTVIIISNTNTQPKGPTHGQHMITGKPHRKKPTKQIIQEI